MRIKGQMQEDLTKPKTNHNLKATLQPHLPHSIWHNQLRAWAISKDPAWFW